MVTTAFFRRKQCLHASALLLAVSSIASAQSDTNRSADDEPVRTARGSSLSSRLSASVAQRLLHSEDLKERIRGIRRLGGQSDYSSIQILLQTIDDSPGLVADPILRLEAVRALAPFAGRDPVRRLLVGWAGDTTTRGRTVGPMGDLVREQAAMALAASSNNRALEQLVLAVIDGGPAGDRAARALAAHPPRNLEPLLTKVSLKSPGIVETLGRIGDLRALPKLREVLKNGDIGVQVAAAVALARLGDASGVEDARDWIKQEGSTHALRVGAARTLTLARDPFAPRAIAIVLADPATRDVGLSLAEEAPTPQLSPTLAGLLTIAKGPDRVRVLAALARAGGPLAVRTLAPLARKSPVDVDAAYALAQCRHEDAADVIGQLLTAPSTRRTGARAGLVRALELGQKVDGLSTTLEAMAGSQDAADRAVAIFGLVATGEASVEDYTKSKDATVVLAACRGAMARSSQSLDACAALLTDRLDPITRDGLSGALLGIDAIPTVSTDTLLGWAESSRVSAPIFARALGPRDADSFRKRIEDLLTSGDPATRSQVAIGLGHSRMPSSASLLTQAYAFEADPWVRRAIVIGLAARQSAVGRPWLARAATLDPDEQVRSLARLAMVGYPPSGLTRGDHVLWLRLSASNASESTGHRPVRILMSSGYATIAVTAPDGEVLVPGVPPGQVRIGVAGTELAQESSKK